MLRRYLPELAVFSISLGLYLATLAPTVTGEDSGELITAAYGWGVAHPPGYPLWTMLAGVFVKIIPFASAAYRVNLLSAVLAASAAVVVCRILRRFFQVPAGIAVAGALCMAIGRHLWSQAVIAEVYTLHIFLFCLILYFLLAWLQNTRPLYLYGLSFFTGLALCNHHLTLLLGPVLLLTVLFTKARTFIQIKTVLLCILFLGLGLLPYLYIPLAARRAPAINWGEPDNAERLWRHVARKQYGDDAMHAPRSFRRFGQHARTLGQWNIEQYSWAAVPFILLGLMRQLRRRRRVGLVLLGLFLMHTLVLGEILNFTQQRQDLWCTRVFILPAYVITALWLTLGGQTIYDALSRWFKHVWFMKYFGHVVVLTVFGIALYNNYASNNLRHYYYAADHARNILNTLEDQALILPSGDHNTFPLLYLHYVENQRPDIIIADKYGYIEYDLYKDMPDAPRRIRTLRQREEIEAYLIQHSGRPVYYTVKPTLRLLPDYHVVDVGMLFRVCPPETEQASFDIPIYKYRNTETDPARDNAADIILSDYNFYLASLALHEKQTAQALDYIEQAAILSEGLKEEMNNLATLLMEFHMPERAIPFYEEAARLDENYLTPRWNLMHLFKAQGDIVHAIQVLNDLARLDEEDFRVFGELGFLLYQHGDTELAIKNWGKSLSLNPDQPQIIAALAQIAPRPRQPQQKI